MLKNGKQSLLLWLTDHAFKCACSYKRYIKESSSVASWRGLNYISPVWLKKRLLTYLLECHRILRICIDIYIIKLTSGAVFIFLWVCNGITTTVLTRSTWNCRIVFVDVQKRALELFGELVKCKKCHWLCLFLTMYSL